jgi:LysR family transcriptional regulator, low CO2-responsive transcriptional regulator
MFMPLDSRQLRAFSILSQTGSFTETARSLNLSQSAISHAIKALEGEVRCRLLDRVGKKVILTQAGEQLLIHANKILETMSTARDEIEHLGKWGRGRLRIGASTTACQHILPAVLREFKESFPQCTIHIEPGDTPHSMEMLRSHRIDLALAMELQDVHKFDFRPLFTDELLFIVSPLHPWAQAGRVDRSSITKQSYIVYHKTSYTVQMVEDYFRSENLVLQSFIELGSMEAIKEMVKIGVGISILAPWIARKELAEKSLVALPLGKRKLRRHWGIVHWRGRRLSLAEETFVGLCKSFAEVLNQ